MLVFLADARQVGEDVKNRQGYRNAARGPAMKTPARYLAGAVECE